MALSEDFILTGSLENFRASRERGFGVVGMKEGRRRLAEEVEPGDQIFFYVTGVQAFGAIARITGALYEDRTRIWPGKPGKADAYPWRFESEQVLLLDEDRFLPADSIARELEHVRKWPAAHWRLAFQGQLRRVSDTDGRLLAERMTARAGGRAPAPA